MSAPELIHASCVAIAGRGVLLAGPSGAGKSDLALRLIDRGAMLVADDYSELRERDGRLFASPPERLAGLIEVRGIGVATMPYLHEVEVALILNLDPMVERMPEFADHHLAGVAIPAASLVALEPSAPIKAELLLRTIGR